MSHFSTSLDKILCSVVIIVAVFSLNSCSAADELEQIKPRRGGTVGLFAFPRVGRSDPSMYNNYRAYGPNQGSYEEYDDLQHLEWKRNEGLVPFPRVGRSDNNQLRKWSRLAALQQDMDKRTGASANSGLWFGPRLGRIQKRAADAGGLSGDNRLDVYTPRLGRESNEIFDDFGNTGTKIDYVDMFHNLENYDNNNNNNKINNRINENNKIILKNRLNSLFKQKNL